MVTRAEVMAMLADHGADADTSLGGGGVVVDGATAFQSYSGDDILLVETAAGVAFEFFNGEFRPARDGQTYTLHAPDDYRVQGQRWQPNS